VGRLFEGAGEDLATVLDTRSLLVRRFVLAELLARPLALRADVSDLSPACPARGAP
jgi:hypothetical protein